MVKILALGLCPDVIRAPIVIAAIRSSIKR
jgi:hypothetical protein